MAEVHPSSARQLADDQGLLPEWLVYHELITTTVWRCRFTPGWKQLTPRLLSSFETKM